MFIVSDKEKLHGCQCGGKRKRFENHWMVQHALSQFFPSYSYYFKMFSFNLYPKVCLRCLLLRLKWRINFLYSLRVNKEKKGNILNLKKGPHSTLFCLHTNTHGLFLHLKKKQPSTIYIFLLLLLLILRIKLQDSIV